MKAISLGLFFLILILLPSPSYATPEYTGQTGFACLTCHIDATGGKLTKAGEEFRGDLKTRGLYRPLKPFQRVIRFIIGYLHLLMAIAWFGTILYVHILLKPAYAAKGLPKGELILGWLGIVILSITGVLLTISRIPTWEAFFSTRFGVLLGLKILLFLIMVTTAVIVTFIIGPKLRKQKSFLLPKNKDRLTLEELSRFNGMDRRPAYFAYKGKVYDVSLSKFWKDGSHMKKHPAGNDLTETIKKAPHGEEKIFQALQVAELLPTGVKIEKSAHEKIFYFMAYMNLIFVFLITFIIALWRWW